MTTAWAAPGRVNLIGEHVDYNDGLVLPFALQFTTRARVMATETGTVLARSTAGGGPVEFPVGTEPGSVTGWAAYVAGMVWALRQQGHHISGLTVDIESDLPIGAGLSSSAALECAVGAAIGDELGLGLSRRQIAALSHAADHGFVGVPSGVMDQFAAMLCERGHAMLLDCRSLEAEQVPLDLDAAGLALLVLDTAEHHSLADGQYAQRRADCEAAAAALGLESLRDATLDQLGELTAPRLRRRARHVVSEIQRVRDAVAALRAGRIAALGPLLTASHRSLRDDYEVSTERLDAVVEAAGSAGALGARLIGGGFGGSAIALCRAEDARGIESAVRSAYSQSGWSGPSIWPVAAAAGARRLDMNSGRHQETGCGRPSS
ncbi:MAG TPA: galactokinase [Nocardioidaceae bacterium]|nr:galactokinase [Nocardioidaceae bacterium]